MFAMQNPVEVKTTPLLVGNYVHSYFESKQAHEAFVSEHQSDILTKDGKPRADFGKADKMIERLEDTDLFQFFYNGIGVEKEVIITGELFGANWKGKIDSLNVEKGYFCDLKTTAKIDNRFWHADTHEKVSWFDEYGYGLQMAAYKKLLQMKYHKPFNCYIFAVDKTGALKGDKRDGVILEKDISPAVEAFEVDHDRFEAGLAKIEEYQPRLLQVLSGEIEPRRCGHCDYCKATYQPQGFKSLDEIGS